MIAALFVAPDGCYTGLPDVDPWDEARDARLYAGPYAVAAHPPSLKIRQENVNMGVTDGCWKHPSASDQPDLCERFKMADVSIPEVRAIVTRAEALAAALPRYFPGTPCRYGHVAERNVSSYGCLECARQRANAWHVANPEKRREINRACKKKNAVKIADQKRAWRKANPDKHNAANQRWKINRRLKICDFDALFDAQSGKCAICGTARGFSGGGDNRRLAIDHCHKTLKVRGLLCGNCNRMLGLARDDPALLRRAAAYLEELR